MATSLRCVVKKVSNGPLIWSGADPLDLLVQPRLVTDGNNAPAYNVPPWACQGSRDGLAVLSTRCIALQLAHHISKA